MRITRLVYQRTKKLNKFGTQQLQAEVVLEVGEDERIACKALQSWVNEMLEIDPEPERKTVEEELDAVVLDRYSF